MTSRSELLGRLSVVIIAALGWIILGYSLPAHGDDPPECVGDWPNPDSCFPDILCGEYADFWNERRAVVHIYGPDISGTGVLINNANCDAEGQDCGKPYLLTAYHVGSGAMGKEMTNGQRFAIREETMFTFGLEAATCGGPTAGVAVAFKGAWILEESVKRDLLLLRLKTDLPHDFSAYFVGWGKGTMEQAVAIGHPCGAPKRIAVSWPGFVELREVVGKAIYDVQHWEDGALANGSSGSPLLDMETGSLHGVFTHTDNAGPRICFHPDWPADDVFTALPSILEALPENVDGNRLAIDPYDPKPKGRGWGSLKTVITTARGRLSIFPQRNKCCSSPTSTRTRGPQLTLG